MEKIHTILKKHFKTPLPLLILYAAVGFFVVAGVVVMYGDKSSCGGSHTYNRTLFHNGERHRAAGDKQTICCPACASKFLVEPEQTICPVMAMSADKNIFAEHKGKKVYFCCPACKGEFEEDPEKYVSKLPQFQS